MSARWVSVLRPAKVILVPRNIIPGTRDQRIGARRDPGHGKRTNNATVTGLITLAKGCFMSMCQFGSSIMSIIQRGSAPALISVNESPLRPTALCRQRLNRDAFLSAAAIRL